MKQNKYILDTWVQRLKLLNESNRNAICMNGVTANSIKLLIEGDALFINKVINIHGGDIDMDWISYKHVILGNGEEYTDDIDDRVFKYMDTRDRSIRSNRTIYKAKNYCNNEYNGL